MPCLTCQRRQRPCNENRPRCLSCKTSHLRCTYDSPPQAIDFHNESSATMSRPKSYGTTKHRRQSGSGSNASSTRSPMHDIIQGYPDNRDGPESLSWGNSTINLVEASPHFSFSCLDDFDQDFGLYGPTYQDLDFDGMMDLSQENLMEPIPVTFLPTADMSHRKSFDKEGTEVPGATFSTTNADTHQLPRHLLAQHFAQQLTGRYSFKSSQWTYYTYFFHRFSTTHPWVLSAILAWTSANLFYAGKVKSLETALSHYQESLAQISKSCGRDLEDVACSWPASQDHDRDRQLSEAKADDIDALFVAYFFLALHDLISARPHQVRKILRFISHVLKVPNVWDNMGGVRSRVATWFCTLDGKASTFEPGDGAVIDAIGGQDGVASALWASYTTLQQVYSIIYPDQERKEDEIQLPLLERMYRLMTILRDITKYKHTADKIQVHHLRNSIDTHAAEIRGVATSESFKGRIRSTWLVLQALYDAVEISFSRAFYPLAPRYSADAFATSIISITQQLHALRSREVGTPTTSPPPTKIWPLPLVMAAIEVRDPVYREWAQRKMQDYEATGGDHYKYARQFVDRMCEAEDAAHSRVDFSEVIPKIQEGLII